MMRFPTVPPIALKVGVGILLLAALGVAAWFLFNQSVPGTVIASVTTEDGLVRAVVVDLEKQELQFVPAQNEQTLLMAAVPSPNGAFVAEVSRVRGEPRLLSIVSADGRERVEVERGDVETPVWSSDGGSVAFAVRMQQDAMLPEAWSVHRALRAGTSFEVGTGYHPFPGRGQETLALSSSGVALLTSFETPPTIVIASPVPVPASTPFAVSPRGTRVAWVAPADRSLQVFERREERFVPILLATTTAPQSIVFSENGNYLLGATYQGATTTLVRISLVDGALEDAGAYTGLLKLHTWTYEE